MDIGVHALDFYQYVLEPEWRFVSALDDGFAGPEGLAQMSLEANGAPVTMRLSRYFRQDYIARLAFERATVTVNIFQSDAYLIEPISGAPQHIALPADEGGRSVATQLLNNFIASARGRETAICEAASSLPVIELLDLIYRSAARYPAQLGSV
jgi:predicted dehydrogenase